MFKPSVLQLLLSAVVATAMAGTSTTNAQAPNPASYKAPSLEEMFKRPTMAGLTVSRSGKYLAATSKLNGRMNLTVLDLETRKATALTSFTDLDVVAPIWIGDERLVFSVGQYGQPNLTGDFTGGGLFVVNRDGSGYRQLAPSLQQAMGNNSYVYRSLEFFRLVPGSTDEIIAIGNQTTLDAMDLYRVNLTNGRMTLLTGGRPAVLADSYLLDDQLVPRVVVGGIKDSLTRLVYYRDDEKSPWRELARYDALTDKPFVPLAIEKSGKTLRVAAAKDRDTMAIYRYDPATKTLGEMLAGHPRFDMGANAQGDTVGGVLMHPETDELLGYVANADKPERVWVNETWRRTQATIDAALPGRVNAFRRTTGSQVLISSYSDTMPRQWFILDEAKRTMEELVTSKPELEGKLVKQHPFRFTTRDGLEMTGYYFLPASHKSGDAPLPTILHIHGGPSVRADEWGEGFGYLEGQLFASRGYAVIVPNFRITPGMGVKNYQAGFGTYGRQMIDDHADAVKWAADKGFTDPKKVCISGASYGGYAALMGPIRTPGVYQCVISGLAPTDLKYQLTSMYGDAARSIAGQTFRRHMIGAKDNDDGILAELSPITHASKIKVPVFMYAGRSDVRVPYGQIERMAEELTKAGNTPKGFVVKTGEGHGFTKPENNIDLYGKLFDFVKDSIGSGRP